MKALCVKQPWAMMIAEGKKTIETRTWLTRYRGPLVIVASKTPDYDALAAFDLTKEDCGEFGVAVCVANLVDCREMNFGDETAANCDIYPGAFAWVLRDIRHIAPFPVKGQLGLFDIPVPVNVYIEACKKQEFYNNIDMDRLAATGGI